MTKAPRRLDVHHHAIPREWRRELERIGADRSGGSPLPDWDEATTLRMMDAQGIGAAVVSVSAPGVWFGERTDTPDLARRCNDAIARLVADHPGRFAGLAILPLPLVDASLRELRRALDDLALEGVILLASVGGTYLGHPVFDPVLEELQRRRAVALIHPTEPPGFDALGLDLPSFLLEFPFDTTRAAVNLIASGTLARCPDVTFILSHAGGVVPFLAHRIEAVGATLPAMKEHAPEGPAAMLGRFHLDTAISTGPASLAALSAFAPHERILFGTDHPYVPEKGITTTVAGLDGWDIPDAAREAVLRGNALRLFPRLARRMGETA